MAKSNIRSMRFSDTMIEMIEAQTGDTFTAKFEALVTRCMWELPEKEEQLKQIEKRIDMKREQLLTMSEQTRQLENTINEIRPRIQQLRTSIDRAVQKWDGNTE